eukprot:Partr_v1_DN28059_c1_g2_i1_m57050 putative Zinc finger, FYVE domain containing 20
MSGRVLGSGQQQAAPESAAQVPNDQNIVVECPICGEVMTSEAQVNRHLDDQHFGTLARQKSPQEISPSSWLQEVVRRKVGSGQRPASNSGMAASKGQSSSSSLSGLVKSLELGVVETSGEDEQLMRIIRRSHWTQSDICSHPQCRKGIAGIGGLRFGDNCRKCGKSFCDTHLQCWMRLSPAAEHDPDNGGLVLVCHSCFTSRIGYADFHGKTRSRNGDFLSARQRRMDKIHLEANMLALRLAKLVDIHASFRIPTGRTPELSRRQNISVPFRSLKEAEQSVVQWQKDDLAIACPDCSLQFNLLSKRRHHCRLCGKIICHSCSILVSLSPSHSSKISTPRLRALSSASPANSSRASSATDLANESNEACGIARICTSCNELTFCRIRHEEELNQIPALVKLYESMLDIKTRILDLLPRYNQILGVVVTKEFQLRKDPDAADIFLSASSQRAKLLSSFSEFDKISKRIFGLPSSNSEQTRLQRNIFNAANMFLQTNMLTLQMLPKFKQGVNDITDAGESQQLEPALPPERSHHIAILEEQKVQLKTFMDNALKKRLFDDVRALQRSLDDIEAELERAKSLSFT